jgi:hypothetical protein
MSEFLAIKRALLEEQRETIESETKKFNKMIEMRSNEVNVLL